MKSKGRFQLLSFGVLALLLCSVVAAFTIASHSTPARAASAPTGLHVVGNQIEDGSGHIIVPHGVDRMGGEYSCIKSASNGGGSFDGGVGSTPAQATTQAVVNSMLAWDINIVRIPLNEDCWLGINGEPADGTTAAQYQTDVINWVNLLNANGIIAILDLHWTNNGTNVANAQQLMPDLDHAPAFWTSVATAFKNNSSVMFDLFNEPALDNGTPTATDWLCWRNGSTAPSTSPCASLGYAVAGMQTMLNAVRATGATNVVLVGGMNYANDLTGWLANEPTDPDNNLVASMHLYPNNYPCGAQNGSSANNVPTCLTDQVLPVAAKVPVLIGEVGEYDCGDSFLNTVLPWFDSEGIGYLAWTFLATDNCSGTPSLISDAAGDPTAYGQGYMQHLISLGGTPPPTATPTPTATATHTPTPTPTSGTNPTPTPTHTPTPTPTTSSGGSSCKVDYAITAQWPGGFGASFTITNTGTTTISGWSLQFSFANGQTITQLWNGSYTQSGSAVTITNLSYNGSIAPGATLSSEPGFNGTWNGTNSAPTSFTLNGVKCSS